MATSVLAARLTEAQSTAVFRSLLDAMCRPGVARPLIGRNVTVPEWIPRILLPVLALADLDLRVHVVPGHPSTSEWAQGITRATGAPHTQNVAEADWVIAAHGCPESTVAQLRIGSALAPERGSWLVLGCTGVTSGVEVTVTGPGTDGVERFTTDTSTAVTLAQIAQRNMTPPTGVDTFLIDPHGSVLALPRSATWKITP